MEEVVYLILSREGDTFNIIYVAQSEKTEEKAFFTKNDKFKCWIANAGSEENLYLSIYPMSGSEKKAREKIVNKTIARYNPICNLENAS